MKTSLQAAVITYLILAAGSCSAAQDLPKERAVNAIIGEAEGEGYRGMLAVACAIRNRGSLAGVYGERSRRVKEKLYSEDVELTASVAWAVSADPEICQDLVEGATHWEGTAFPEPRWARKMVQTAVIGHQRFYKRKGG
jgi:hypothetical protein